ncbi:MAG: hypothetical protein K2I26_01975, partial [Paramuribaculum sp.]|nr:hypothetical protein [Paramuribaculum sp.]
MAVRDNGSSGSSRAGFGIGHGRQSAPSPSPACSYHLNRSDEPPAMRVERLVVCVLGAVRDNGPSAALLSALGFGHGRQSAP